MVLLFVLLLFTGTATAAVLHGTVYDIELNELNNVIVEVDSTPHQRFVSKDGVYTFNLLPGNYTITANYTDGLDSFTVDEKVQISDDGDYVFDMFIFPSLDNEAQDMLDSSDIVEIDDDVLNGTEELAGWIAVIGVLAFLLAAAYLIFKPKKSTGVDKTNEDLPDKDLNNMIELIRKEGGRITQKQLRKQIPMSEAKISLMVSDLEHKGTIKKVKKGRGNLIILKK